MEGPESSLDGLVLTVPCVIPFFSPSPPPPFPLSSPSFGLLYNPHEPKVVSRRLRSFNFDLAVYDFITPLWMHWQLTFNANGGRTYLL